MTDTKLHTVRIEDEIQSIEEDIEELKEEYEETDDEERQEELNEIYHGLEERRMKLRETLDEWGGGEFQVRELSYGDVMRAKDEVTKASYEVDGKGGISGVPRDGFYRIKVLNIAVEGSPNGAPDDPRDYPIHVGEWLFNKVDSINTMGEHELENLSLSDWQPEEEEEKQEITP